MLKYLLICATCMTALTARAQEREWHLEKRERWAKEQQMLDSMAIAHNTYMPSVLLKAKTQFPVQHALGLEFLTRSGLSFYGGMGRFSRCYTLAAMGAVSPKNAQEEVRQAFFKERLRSGLVTEIGVNYYFLKKGYYTGMSLQFQRFSLSGTVKELMENLDLGDSQGLGGELDELLQENEFLEDFYERETVYPTFTPLQLGLLVGKRFHFKKHPYIGMHIELGYNLNISQGTRIETDRYLTQALMDRVVNPLIKNTATESFSALNYPFVSVGISAGFGKIIRPKQIRYSK